MSKDIFRKAGKSQKKEYMTETLTSDMVIAVGLVVSLIISIVLGTCGELFSYTAHNSNYVQFDFKLFTRI